MRKPTSYLKSFGDLQELKSRSTLRQVQSLNIEALSQASFKMNVPLKNVSNEAEQVHNGTFTASQFFRKQKSGELLKNALEDSLEFVCEMVDRHNILELKVDKMLGFASGLLDRTERYK